MYLEPVASGLDQPVYVTAPPGDKRLFVVELEGRVRILRDGVPDARPFLDISMNVSRREAQGAYGLAFHPQYRTNGFLFISYSDADGVVHIDRYTVSSDPDSADIATRLPVLVIPQPHGQHNGGHIVFGRDGMLWTATGDGGYSDSAGVNISRDGQPGPLLGKLLRIDVSREQSSAVVTGEGLRNPWRFSFDSTGLIYIADVGHMLIEEINIEPASRNGLNFGWPVMEGDECFASDTCNREGLTLPKLTYRHGADACSVIGGTTYHGLDMPELSGHYFYSDFCGGWLRSFRYSEGRVTDQTKWKTERVGHVVSFGNDASGELYLVAQAGTIYRLTRTRP